MRRRTRVFILAAVCLVLIGVVGGAVLVRQHSLRQHALECRALGMEAARAGKHKEALHNLGTYLQRFGLEEDAEALYEYARARKHLPLPNGKHLDQAKVFLLRALGLDPDYTEAQHELLDVYLALGFFEEALVLADSLLEDDPDDLTALRAKVEALHETRQVQESLQAARHIATLSPRDTKNHLAVMNLMRELSMPDSEIKAYAGSQPELQPGHYAYQLVQARAHQLVGDLSEARRLAREASQNVPADSPDVEVITGQLDRLGLFDESLELLRRTAGASSSAVLKERYCQRLFEQGQLAALLEKTEVEDLSEATGPVLALRAWTFGILGKKQEVETIVQELDGRSDNAIDNAWSKLLRAVYLDEGTPPSEIAQICRNGLESDRYNPFFHHFLGAAQAQLGERDEALMEWQRAAECAPTWPDPRLRVARLMADTGRYEEAIAMANIVLKLGRTIFQIAEAVQIIGASTDVLSPADLERLLGLCQKVQADFPGEQRTLPLMVELLAGNGQAAEAAEAVESALAGEAPLSQETLVHLADLCQKHSLGHDEACLERAEAAGGMTPGLAYAKAASIAKQATPEQAREFFLSAASKAEDNLTWKLVTARLLEVTGPAEDATAAWKAVADDAGQDAGVLQQILSSNAAWEDMSMIESVMSRLKDIAGENAVAWRAARARWLLDTDDSQEAAAEAASLLSDTMRTAVPNIPRHILLAKALVTLDNKEGAINCLEQAAVHAPKNPAVRFPLVGLLEEVGKTDAAEKHMEEILATPGIGSTYLRLGAEYWARRNDPKRAIALIEQANEQEDSTPEQDLVLARLYRLVGQNDKAESILARILDERPTAAAVDLMAGLLAAQGRKEEAEETLRLLDTMEIDPGMRELAQAEYRRLYGTKDEAAEWYEKALAAAPDKPAIWRRMLSFALRSGDTEGAVARIAAAAAACPADEGLSELAAKGDLLEQARGRSLFSPLLLAAVEAPQHTPQVVEALQVMVDTPAEDKDQLASSLCALARQHPAFLAVNMELVRFLGNRERYEEAANLASQAMLDFPNQAEPARLAAVAYSNSNQWAEKMEAAREWRRRSPGNAPAADLMIASAHLDLDQPDEALKTIEPYLDDDPGNPDAFSPFIDLQVRALIRGGRVDEANEVLQPHLATSASWRAMKIRCARFDIADEATAAQWLEEANSNIPEDAIAEQIGLVTAWFSLAGRFQQDRYRRNAQERLEALAARPDVAGEDILRGGVAAERNGDYELAESHYRLALQLDPGLYQASNNLAMSYISNARNLDEALRLAEETVQAASGIANYHDTLAQAQAALGDYESAIKSLERAAELEPENREWTDRAERYRQRERESRTGAGS